MNRERVIAVTAMCCLCAAAQTVTVWLAPLPGAQAQLAWSSFLGGTGSGTVLVDFLNLKYGDANDSNNCDWMDVGPFSGCYGSSW